MERKNPVRNLGLAGIGFLMLVSVGCKDIVNDVEPPSPEKFPAVQDIPVAAPAGLPNPPAQKEPVAFAQMVSQVQVETRHDVMALFPDEVAYDVKARNERIFQQSSGFFGSLFIPKVPVVKVEPIEPQPFRRLSGVLIGDSVMAIIDMGNGQTEVIRPGMQIPNSPWKVKSITAEEAVLTRDGTKKPNEIIVRLQGPQQGSDNGFNPGSPPPGFGGQPQNPQSPPAGGGRRGRFGGAGGGRIGGGGGSIN